MKYNVGDYLFEKFCSFTLNYQIVDKDKEHYYVVFKDNSRGKFDFESVDDHGKLDLETIWKKDLSKYLE